MKIKQRLLEHVAAALSIVNSIPPAPTLTAFVKKDLLDTPPATPEKQKRQRQGPERISVYALLAGVKSEVQRTIICTT